MGLTNSSVFVKDTSNCTSIVYKVRVSKLPIEMKCVLVTIAIISTLETIASVQLIPIGIGSEGEFQYVPKEEGENGVVTVPGQVNSENGGEYKLMEEEGVDRNKRSPSVPFCRPQCKPCVKGCNCYICNSKGYWRPCC